jgi:hypothetical protein
MHQHYLTDENIADENILHAYKTIVEMQQLKRDGAI